MRYFRHLRFTSSCRDTESTHSCVYTHRNTYPCSVSDIPLTSPKSRILFKNRFSKSVGSTSVKGFFSETISGSGCGGKKKKKSQVRQIPARTSWSWHFKASLLTVRVCLSLLSQLFLFKSCLLLDREFLPFVRASLSLADLPHFVGCSLGLIPDSDSVFSQHIWFSFLSTYFPPCSSYSASMIIFTRCAKSSSTLTTHWASVSCSVIISTEN